MTLAAVDIAKSLQTAFNSLLGFLPNIIGFLVILIVGYFVAKVVKTVLTKVLQKVGLDRQLKSGHMGRYVEQASPDASPSKLVGAVGFWLVFLFALTASIGALKIPAVTRFMNQVLAFLPNVIAAVIIFVIAGAIAGAVVGLANKTMGDTPTGKLVQTVVPLLVMGIGFFMILNQLHIAPQIVTITYAALLGAGALGMALAFGLGGRNVAGRMLEEAYQRGRSRTEDAKDDMRLGRERAEQTAREQLPTQGNGPAPGARPTGGTV